MSDESDTEILQEAFYTPKTAIGNAVVLFEILSLLWIAAFGVTVMFL